jgi:CRP-like cAMP-binding protein
MSGAASALPRENAGAVNIAGMSATTGINLFRHSPEFETFQAGDRVFTTGEPGNVMYAVRSGQVDLLVGERVVETVGEGGIFGEMALIDKEPRSATAVARTACELVPVTGDRFKFLVQQTPGFAVEVLKVMTRRIREANNG